ncbi:S-Ena type endospore appendage [Legionella spiritensis]|uniref:Endospore appendages core domain-containing protein n=1 Tax=Legionella spiritensis TaxID=452 RepID=A0A0W0Z5C5_LEGSP|nr:S-Ena type endospore appendage [Legionella spiritensis]KTD63910.1 hypothetical protein Lspi_1429 [Legionella spiritensis]SNV36459.1 Uncharacterised protein [Legionella spiritensis]VEG89948.1 Uncharacterised protein [Legionella spiritensis]
MSKILKVSVALLFGAISIQAYAQKTISLAPNENKLLTNSALWTLNATCHVQSNKTVRGKIKISVLKNQGTINGKKLSTGQATLVTVKNSSNISVSAEAGAQINLTNLGAEGLQAVCST